MPILLHDAFNVHHNINNISPAESIHLEESSASCFLYSCWRLTTKFNKYISVVRLDESRWTVLAVRSHQAVMGLPSSSKAETRTLSGVLAIIGDVQTEFPSFSLSTGGTDRVSLLARVSGTGPGPFYVPTCHRQIISSDTTPGCQRRSSAAASLRYGAVFFILSVSIHTRRHG